MPFALVIIGLLLVISGAKGTYKEFGAQVASEFTGDNNFTYWLASLGAVGALGYVEQLRTFSRMFMALILVGMVIRNGGVFDKFSEALNKGPEKPATKDVAASKPVWTSGNALADNSLYGKLGQTFGVPNIDVPKYESYVNNGDAVAAAADKENTRVMSNFGKVASFVGRFIFGGPAF